MEISLGYVLLLNTFRIRRIDRCLTKVICVSYDEPEAKYGKKTMPTKHSFIVKVVDARMSDLRKVLKGAGIDVVSIAEIHKEEIAGEGAEEPGAEKSE